MPDSTDDVSDARSFLLKVNDIIHPEVLKLYPDARPPEFLFEDADNGALHVWYRSARQMDALAVGLIRGCGRLFDETVTVTELVASTPTTAAEFLVEFAPSTP